MPIEIPMTKSQSQRTSNKSGGGSGVDGSGGWGEWADIAMAPDTEVRLDDPPRGVELEYRIVAINKAGEQFPKQYRNGGTINKFLIDTTFGSVALKGGALKGQLNPFVGCVCR